MRLFLLLIALLLGSTPAWASKTILVFGDSLSAGYGIPISQAWPTQLEKRLLYKRFDYNVANLSVSGETSAGGLRRLPAALAKHKPAILIIALGANDGLRGLPLTALRDNLKAMTLAATKAKAKVLIVGMKLPPNYGPYGTQFDALFTEIARQEKLALVDFLLAGIADQPAYFQPDLLHPTAAAQIRLLDNVWPPLLPLLAKSR